MENKLLSIRVDFGRTPGMMPPPIQIRYATSDIPETVTLEDSWWIATYAFGYKRKGELLYNLSKVEMKTPISRTK